MNYTNEIAQIKKNNDLDFIDLQSYEIKVIQGKGKLEPYDEYIIKKRLDKIKAINRLIDIVNEVQRDTVFDKKELMLEALRRQNKAIDDLLNFEEDTKKIIKAKTDLMINDWVKSSTVLKVIQSKSNDFRAEILDNIEQLLQAYFDNEVIPNSLYENHSLINAVLMDIMNQIILYRRAKKQ